MRFLTWNIRNGGGRRAGEICRFVGTVHADFIAFAEFRVGNESELRAELTDIGYRHIVTSDPVDRQNGLLVAAKEPLALVMDNFQHDRERWLSLHLTRPALDVLVVHIPGAPDKKFAADGTGISGQARKERFWKRLIKYADDRRERPAVLIGDFNTGLRADAEGAMFKLSHYLESLLAMGFVDTWRDLHQHDREYTWYSERKDKTTGESEDHNGFRLDYIFVSPALARSVNAAEILHQPRQAGISDHAPLIADLAV